MKPIDFNKIALKLDLAILYKIKFDVELNYNVQSFYDNAQVIFADDEIFLQSYNTIVCKINKHGKFVRLWEGSGSIRLLGHLNRFLFLFGISGGGKDWWDAQPCQI